MLCARCTRFSEQISGDPFIALVERGRAAAGRQVRRPALQLLLLRQRHPDLPGGCPDLRRPTGSRAGRSTSCRTRRTCEHCAGGCQLRVDHRHFQVKRRLAGDAPEVNEEWNCDKGRFAFVSGRGDDRITRPLVREDGVLRVASWPEAIDAAVAGLTAAGTSVGVLTGGRLTLENAYGYSQVRPRRARHQQHRLPLPSAPVPRRPTSWPPEVAGRSARRARVTYADLETRATVVLVGLRARGRGAARLPAAAQGRPQAGLRRDHVAPVRADGLDQAERHADPHRARRARPTPLPGWTLDAGTSILVGERAALAPGTLHRGRRRRRATGARLAWVPRRAGDRGAIEAGVPARPAAGWASGGRRRRPGGRRRQPGGSTACRREPGLDADGDAGRCRVR